MKFAWIFFEKNCYYYLAFPLLRSFSSSLDEGVDLGQWMQSCVLPPCQKLILQGLLWCNRRKVYWYTRRILTSFQLGLAIAYFQFFFVCLLLPIFEGIIYLTEKRTVGPYWFLIDSCLFRFFLKNYSFIGLVIYADAHLNCAFCHFFRGVFKSEINFWVPSQIFSLLSNCIYCIYFLCIF